MITMNFKNRFRLVIFSMVLLLVSIAIIVVIGIWHTNMHIREAVDLDELVVNLYKLRILNSEYLTAPSERVKQQWKLKFNFIESKVVIQQNIPQDVKAALHNLQQIFERLTSLTDAAPGIDESSKRLRKQHSTNLNLESQRIIDWASDISMRTKDAIVPHLIIIGAVTLVVMLVAAIVVITMMLLTTRHVLASIGILKEGATEIARGKLGFQVEQGGPDEIAMLTTAINQMSSGLKDSYENLQMRTDQLEAEIEERKQAEGKLRESEELFKLFMNHSPIYTFIKDVTPTRSLVLQASENYRQMIGIPGSEMVGKTMDELFPPEFATKITADDWAVVSRGEVLELEEEFNGKSYATIKFPIARGNKTLLAGYTIDVTERKRAEEGKRSLEERLQRAEKMEALGQLAGGVAHDLNNVLGILSGYSELLMDEIPEGSKSRGHVEKILKSTKKGAAIIDDLLTLARRGVTATDVINLNGIVSDFMTTPSFENIKGYNPRVTFRTECDETLLNIKGSPIHLEKTLMNLVSNAAEAISGEGTVTIRTEGRYLERAIRGYDEIREGDYSVLIVSDTGTGIPGDSREKIFEPFYTKKKMGRSGTGLGLSIVWGTVKDHSGYIDLQTEEGEGTTFTLYFPVTKEELRAEEADVPEEQYMGKGESVLVVDDIDEQREIASTLITKLGYEVHLAGSGEAAVEYLKANKADIIVLDMIMPPGMDGLDTYRKIREINPKQKAVIVSGFSANESVKEAQRLGAGAFVKKPYVKERIGLAIRQKLDGR